MEFPHLNPVYKGQEDVFHLWTLSTCTENVHTCVYTVRFLPAQRRQWQCTPVLLPGESHGRRSLVGYSPWGREDSDTTELHFHFHFHAVEKEMATQSSVLAWRIPGMGEPGGPPSTRETHRVRHDWSDLAAAAETQLKRSIVLIYFGFLLKSPFPKLCLNVHPFFFFSRSGSNVTLWQSLSHFLARNLSNSMVSMLLCSFPGMVIISICVCYHKSLNR